MGNSLLVVREINHKFIVVVEDRKIVEIPISDIDDYEEHPFKVKMDEDMEQLVESLLQNGVITPVVLRKKEDGRYELISGHRRKQACILAGIPTLKSEVRELTRDEAIVLMVEINLQRSEILPSEKAFAYKMRLEAMKRQGRRTDLTYSPLWNKLYGIKSSAELAIVMITENSFLSNYSLVCVWVR